MADNIEHVGIVEDIDGTHLRVRIIQTSACAACSANTYCFSADTKEKLIDIETDAPERFKTGESVAVAETISMGMSAVMLAFVLPFFILIIALFVLMYLLHSETIATLGSLALLVPYYYILSLNKRRLQRRFSFSIRKAGEYQTGDQSKTC
jgi:sigma-E factor negative regulatory protein RseC